VTEDRSHLITRIFQDIEWQYRALCHGRMDLFFSDRNSDNRNQWLTPADRKAKALCARCPVRKECLEYGLGEEFGIWGGTRPPERRGLRRGRATVYELLDEMFEQAVSLGLVAREGAA